jgi:hypothetical protein
VGSSWLSKRAKAKNDQKGVFILEGHFRDPVYIFINWRYRRKRRKKILSPETKVMVSFSILMKGKFFNNTEGNTPKKMHIEEKIQFLLTCGEGTSSRIMFSSLKLAFEFQFFGEAIKVTSPEITQTIYFGIHDADGELKRIFDHPQNLKGIIEKAGGDKFMIDFIKKKRKGDVKIKKFDGYPTVNVIEEFSLIFSNLINFGSCNFVIEGNLIV